MKEINELTVRNFETVAELQLKTAEENVKAGIEQVKNAAAVRDADSWKEYLAAQAAASQEYSDRILTSARSVVELSNAYNTEVQRIMKEAFSV